MTNGRSPTKKAWCDPAVLPFPGPRYDRLVASTTLLPQIKSGSAKALRFDQIYALTTEQVTTVSDHYPVEVTLSIPLGNATAEANSQVRPVSEEKERERERERERVCVCVWGGVVRQCIVWQLRVVA